MLDVIQILGVEGNNVIFQMKDDSEVRIELSEDLADHYKKVVAECHADGEPYLIEYDSFKMIQSGGK